MARITKEMRKIIRATLDEALADAKKASYEYYKLRKTDEDIFDMTADEFDKYMEELQLRGVDSSRMMWRLKCMIEAYGSIGCYYIIDLYCHGDDPKYFYQNAEVVEI